MSTLERLISLANDLDNRGFTNEAGEIDDIIVRLAMSMEEARALLGVSPNASEDDIQKAWKIKALENHPDRGGDEEKMKAVNVARDLLVGERQPDRTYSPSPGPVKKDKMYADEQTGTSFDDAVANAGIPAGVQWKFVTDRQFGTHGFDTNVSGFVAYGTTESEHVFVGVYNKRVLNAFTHLNLDDSKVWTITAPKSEPLSSVAPRAIRELWNKFADVKQYNAKVSLLGEDAVLSPSMGSRVNSISFKDALDIMGEKTPDSWKGRKLSLVMKLADSKNWSQPNIVLVINGKEFPLSEKSNEWAWKTKPPLPRYIMGEYTYSDSKKDMTRMDKDKAAKALGFMVQRLAEWESPELIELLQKILEQVSKK